MKLVPTAILILVFLFVGGIVGYKLGKDSSTSQNKENVGLRSPYSSNSRKKSEPATDISSEYVIVRESDGKRFVSTNPEEVLRWYLSSEVDSDDSSKYRRAIVDLLSTAPHRLQALLEESNVQNPAVGSVVVSFLMALTQHNEGCQKLTEWATENPRFYSNEEFQKALRRTLWRSSPDSLFSLAEVDEYYQWVAVTAIRRLAESDPTLAQEKVKELSDWENIDKNSLKSAFLAGAGKAISDASEQDMLEMIANLAVEPDAARAVLATVAKESPRKAIAVFDELEIEPHTNAYRDLVSQIAISMSRNESPKTALEWLATKSLDERLSALIPQLVLDLHKEDPELAIEMTSALKTETQDSVLGLIALKAETLAEAVAQASAITDSRQRERALERALLRWYYKDPEEMKKVLPDVQLSEHSLNRLRTRMKEADIFADGELPRSARERQRALEGK